MSNEPMTTSVLGVMQLWLEEAQIIQLIAMAWEDLSDQAETLWLAPPGHGSAQSRFNSIREFYAAAGLPADGGVHSGGSEPEGDDSQADGDGDTAKPSTRCYVCGCIRPDARHAFSIANAPMDDWHHSILQD